MSRHLLPGHRRLLHEVDVLSVESSEVVAAGGCGLGVAWAVAVEECRVGLAVQVTDFGVKTCRKAHSTFALWLNVNLSLHNREYIYRRKGLLFFS